jgi:hypothetical protein
MNIQPLCIPQTNWKGFIQVTQSVLGYSPTRGLDNVLLPKNTDPAAILACLDLENKPLDCLKRRELWGHFHLCFIAELERPALDGILNNTDVKVYYKETYSRYVVILSGAFGAWFDAVITGCCKHSQYPLRKAMNIIYDQLCMMGFKSTFNKSKKQMHDGTFHLV